ncbi:hypothetical protein [Mycolicibacterium confluentis]|uniref:Uncharacterized protein n=1 Tax=Mycolicibacterium confluentis TaxID=28047 RepID=A0A7I7Y1X6_9MYCO|nr:hypothetical protein [Mycolicibacterium confluentis]MCV7320577.1 hypothetical protein [Mycolicibacterium confluentis]ORV30230.1 hypothetical protein AWB99_14090 [Mycolicibacterium confluentis]BBZ35616.1 hypothetical protein MCNF_42210 [Mycolicibacterium confluentis]
MGDRAYAAGDELRAVTEDLADSGLTVTAHGEGVAESHATSDAAVENALSGWCGRSAAAMLARSQEWSSTTSMLLVRLGAHAGGLHACSQTFAAMSAEHAAAIGKVHSKSSATVDPRSM